MANGNGNIIWNSRIQLQLSDQYGEWEQRLHESGALPDQRRESAQLNVNKLTILRLSALIFSPFGVLSILWIKGVEGAPFLDIYLCSLWCPSAFNTLYMWLYCVHLVLTFSTISSENSFIKMVFWPCAKILHFPLFYQRKQLKSNFVHKRCHLSFCLQYCIKIVLLLSGTLTFTQGTHKQLVFCTNSEKKTITLPLSLHTCIRVDNFEFCTKVDVAWPLS